MTQSPPPHRKYRHLSIAVSAKLDGVIREADAKGDWLAPEIGVDPATLSRYRDTETADRNLPAFLVPAVDEKLGGHFMLESIAAMEGCTVHPRHLREISAVELEQIFPLILREEGNLSAEMFAALRDGKIDNIERETLHRHAIKLRRFFQDLEDRTSAVTALRMPA